MNVYSDQEELEKLKAWGKNYGGALLLGVVLGLGLLFGNKYWTQYQEEQRVAASDLYAQMLQQVQASNAEAARASGAKLVDEYANTPYAGLAALMQARLDFETNDAAAARGHLEWAAANATDPAVTHAARLRLGRLHLANGDYDAVLALAEKTAPGFEAEYLELRGDAYLGQGKIEPARAAYAEALKQLPPDASSRRMLEMKHEDAGGARRE